MSLFTHPTPAFAGRLRASVQPSLDQLERAVTDTLAELEPGRRNAARGRLRKRKKSYAKPVAAVVAA